MDQSIIQSNKNRINLQELAEFKAPVRAGTLADRVAKIPAQDSIEPDIPIGIFLQEAYNLYRFCRNDRELLIQKGLDWAIVEELPMRVEFLREVEVGWWMARYSVTPVRTEFERWLAISHNVKKELLHDMEYAFADNHNLMQLLARIKKSGGHDTLDQDLSTLLLMAEQNAVRLQEKGSDPKLVKDLEECGRNFSPLLIKFKVEEIEINAQQTARNRAYLFCAVAVEAIRECARHVFWNDKRHLRGYLSEYFRRRSGRKTTAD
jgi:hypothetical protein